ncbi:MAG: tetratricopeptide repeat protein [Vicinamibacterales bacterium]
MSGGRPGPCLGLVVVLAMLAAPAGAVPRQTPQAAAPLWLVAPFEQTSTGLQERWIGEAVAVLVTDALAAAGIPVYGASDRRDAWDEHGISPAATVSHATLITIGRAAAATHVVSGTYVVTGGRIRITGRVIETAGPSMAEAVEEAGPLPDLLAVLGRISARLAGRGTPLMGPLSAHPAAAVEQFVRGLLAASGEARLTHFTQALAIAPTLHQAALELWRVHDERDAHEAALAAARRVPDGTPLARTAQLRAAISLAALGRLDEARAQLTILSRGPRDAAVWSNLAWVLAAMGQSGAAALAEASAIDPADADIRFNAGYAAWQRGEPATAVASLREAVRLRPEDGQAHYALGHALTALGRTVEAAAEQAMAARYSEELATLVPTDARAWERMLADPREPGLARMGRALAASRARAQEALAEDYRRLGREAMAQGRHDAALAEFRRAAYLRPYDPVTLRLVAAAAHAAGRATESADAETLAAFAAGDARP